MAEVSGYYDIGVELRRRLREPAPGRVQLLTGPRQVGKTTLLLEIAEEWGARALYLAVDAPEAALPGWWEQQWQRAARLAPQGTAVLLLDEVQYLPDWARRLKAEVDRARRQRLSLHVVVTGSTALGLGAGSRETMAGRFERLAISHWSARDLARAFGLAPEEAVKVVVRLGSFPGSMSLRDDLPRWRAYVRDSIMDPALGRDLLALELVRKPALLRQVFAIAAAHPAEIVSLHKLAGLLTERGAMTTIAHYLDLLGQAHLVAAVGKFARGEVRRRAAPPKLVPLSNAFLAAAGEGPLSEVGRDSERWGRWMENACLAFASNCGQTVRYWREEPREVDAVLEGSWGKWVVEVKTGPFTARDLGGLLEFSRRHRSYRPLVVCEEGECEVARAAGVESVRWEEFLWGGVEGVEG